MLAVFRTTCEHALFDRLQYGTTGGVLACTNEQAERLLNHENVTLYKEHRRAAVQLAWHPVFECFTIIGSYLREPADADEPLDLSFLSRAIPGLEAVGYVEILHLRPRDDVPMLTSADILHGSAGDAPLPPPAPGSLVISEEQPAETFRHKCPHCDFTGPSRARVDRHVEMHHEARAADQRAMILEAAQVEREAAEEEARLRSHKPTDEERENFGMLPPWQREVTERGPS